MKSWLSKWFSFSWKKLVLVAALVPVMWYYEQTEFPRVDAFIRDSLQHLNDPSTVETSIVTVNINGKKDSNLRPFTIDVITSIVDKLLTLKPKQIVLCFSMRELNSGSLATDLVKYAASKKNIFFQNDYNSPSNKIYGNLIFNEAKILHISATGDVSFGARDQKARRVLLSYDKQGLADEYDALKELGFETKSPEYFKYSFRLWETDQIYLKNYKQGTFGSYDAKEVLDGLVANENFYGKTIFLGSFDEFSFSSQPSIFNFSDKVSGDNYKSVYFPVADLIANHSNAFIRGDYIKVLPQFRDLPITFVLLLIVAFINLRTTHKLFAFISLIPVYLIFVVISYALTSFYFDFSRSIVLLFFLQYLGIPIIMLSMFKEQESKKLEAINDARIDALLTVSEKVAHDIRSPLSAINLVMAKANFDDPEYKEIFEGAVQRIDETASKILTRYRTKTGSENETTEPIDLNEICSAIIKEKTILNQKIDFELVINTESAMALGLRLDLERIISNIMDNAIFALKNIIAPKIFVSINTKDDMVQLNIADNGTGIPEQVLKLLGTARITTKADTGQGNGIGLLHAKRVIERLNGQFEISSQENVGTTIKISLPKA